MGPSPTSPGSASPRMAAETRPSPSPSRPPSSFTHRRRLGSRASSLSMILGLKRPPSFTSTPPSPPLSPKRGSWEPGTKPLISDPVPISLDLHSAAISPRFYPTPARSPPLSQVNPPAVRSTLAMERASFLGVDRPGKAKQVQAAKDMMKVVKERAKRKNIIAPQYELLELIGKGAFGRVFKASKIDGTHDHRNAYKDDKDRDLVAVKILDIDSTDYKTSTLEKDQAIKDFIMEISILRTLKETKAKNVNIIQEAFTFHSQLWIISEYCPGGSLHTLMRASPTPGLEERFIIPISRELALALKFVHDAGIIHRDIKSGNVLITQEGGVQLCDFGVSSVLDGNSAKRSTIIGTPYWMAPELHPEPGEKVVYGTEIDCWAFGCTVYELATGQPPNAKIAPNRLHLFLAKAPRLEEGDFSVGLREFVSFCLDERPEHRPKAGQILKHAYVANSSKKYPTSSLRELLERYWQWERKGGVRASLWQPLGAKASTMLDPFGDEVVDDEWNFSTTDDFTDAVMSRFVQDDVQSPDFATSQPQISNSAQALSPFEKAKLDQRARRGADQMARIFDSSQEPYKFTPGDDENHDEYSDLPFRRSAAFADKRETMIDLDEAGGSQDLASAADLNLADAETIRAKKAPVRWSLYDDDDDDDRHPPYYANTGPAFDQKPTSNRPRTLEWTFQTAVEAQPPHDNNPNFLAPPIRPQLLHTMTEPNGASFDFVHPTIRAGDDGPILSLEPPDRDSMIDLDAGFATLSRESTNGASSAALSTYSSFTDTTDNEPFSMQAYSDQTSHSPEPYNDRTIRATASEANRTSLHAHSFSEPTGADRTSNGMTFAQHTRGSSLSSEVEHDRQSWFEDRPGHARNISVNESVKSLRDHLMADQDLEDQYPPPPFKDRPLPRSSSNRWIGRRPFADTGSEGPTPAHSDMDEYAYQHVNGSTKSFQRDSPFRDGNRSRRRLDSNASANAVASRQRQQPSIASNFSNRHYRVFSFPNVRVPEVAAMADNSEQEIIVGELMRLLNSYNSGLGSSDGRVTGEQGRRGTTGHVNGTTNGSRPGGFGGFGPRASRPAKTPNGGSIESTTLTPNSSVGSRREIGPSLTSGASVSFGL